jgi:glycosyltransferase involved in cell wall biosynthesis
MGPIGKLPEGPDAGQRAAVETELGLRPGALRLGIVGRPRLEKRVDLAMEAVAACRRGDVELLVLSLADGQPVPGDPRIRAFPHRVVPREEYNRRMSAIDVLVLPFDDGEMLATGTVGDAVGFGLPAVVSSWPFLSEFLGAAGIVYGSSVADLASCIDALSAEQLATAGEAARGLRDRYDRGRIAELHLSVLEEVGTAKL